MKIKDYFQPIVEVCNFDTIFKEFVILNLIAEVDVKAVYKIFNFDTIFKEFVILNLIAEVKLKSLLKSY